MMKDHEYLSSDTLDMITNTHSTKQQQAFNLLESITSEGAYRQLVFALVMDSQDQFACLLDKDLAESYMKIRDKTDSGIMESSVSAGGQQTDGKPQYQCGVPASSVRDRVDGGGQCAKANVPSGDAVDQSLIFLSYQWNSKPIVELLYQRLKTSGYNVWLDIEQINYDCPEDISRGIIGARVVLTCFTDKYFESYNCRAEAEYAFRLKKDVIPIMLQANCVHPEWFGLIINSKLVHDFSDQQLFENSFQGLLRTLEHLNIQKQASSSASC